MTTRYVIRQRITMVVNRYEVWTADEQWNPVAPVAFAQQKRGRLREEVPFYADDSRQQVLFTLKARNVLDVRSVVDVRDLDGTVIGTFHKDFGQSLLISTWHVEQPGLPVATGREASTLYAVARRIGFDLLPYDFVFTAADGRPVMTVVRKWGVRDTYRVEIADDRFDHRVLQSVAVALDALQNR